MEISELSRLMGTQRTPRWIQAPGIMFTASSQHRKSKMSLTHSFIKNLLLNIYRFKIACACYTASYFVSVETTPQATRKVVLKSRCLQELANILNFQFIAKTVLHRNATLNSLRNCSGRKEYDSKNFLNVLVIRRCCKRQELHFVFLSPEAFLQHLPTSSGKQKKIRQ